MEIVNKKTSDLIPYANNARTHSEKQVLQIASSIKEFSFCKLEKIIYSKCFIGEKDKDNTLSYSKPVELCEKYILLYSLKTVLDLFGGSGSTLIACEKTNRVCYMMELDEKYCDVIINRWQDFTGKKAVREIDNALFDDI